MYLGLLGGTFNPVHIGHMRLALEVLTLPLPPLPASAALAASVTRVDLIPCATPAHKSTAGLLPFALRVRLLQAAVAQVQGLGVNPLEADRPGPSYTIDTLRQYRAANPGQRLLFIVGDEAFCALPQWHEGLRLPELTDMLVVSRAGMNFNAFCAQAQTFWPDAHTVQQPAHTATSATPPLGWLETAGGGRIIWVALPRLDIDASSIRRHWRYGHSLQFLLPDVVLTHLQQEKACVDACWAHA